MNKSKKIKSKKQVVIHDKKQDRLVNSKVLTIASIVFVVILVGTLLFDQLYERTYLTIDNEKYQMDDLAYYFYTVETQYDYLNQMLGGSYWDMVYDETTGVTVRDLAKEEAINTAVKNEVLYKEAVAEGYTLTDEEISTVEKDVTSMLEEQLTEEIIDKNDFTKEYLTEHVSKSALVSRYRQDKIDALDIDDEAIKAGVNYDDYRQYDVEYLYVTTENTDDEGNAVAMSEEEKAAVAEKINTLYASAKTTEDWSTLIAEDEEGAFYRKDNFIETDSTFDDATEAIIMGMENNTMSEVIEAESAYYIVRMWDNNSPESYDSAVADAISTAENDGFDEVYATILEKYDYTINENALRSLTMGSITLAN